MASSPSHSSNSRRKGTGLRLRMVLTGALAEHLALLETPAQRRSELVFLAEVGRRVLAAGMVPPGVQAARQPPPTESTQRSEPEEATQPTQAAWVNDIGLS